MVMAKMFTHRFCCLGKAALALGISAVSALAMTTFAHAQQVKCEQTPEGRICRFPQEITAGSVVGSERERVLGLVTVDGKCSGTLMNRFWVLTARHCVTTNLTAFGPLAAANALSITASWAPGTVVHPSEIREFGVNIPTAVRDIVMIYLGQGDFGRVNTQFPYIKQFVPVKRWRGAQLKTTDVVSQFGRGLSTFATGSFETKPPTAKAAAADGTYLTATFNPSSISQDDYRLNINEHGQIGQGGDSGGPTVVFESDRPFVAGVLVSCHATGHVPGAPIPPGKKNPGWLWATGASFCTGVSVERFVREIGTNMQVRPECTAINACPIPTTMDYLLSDTLPSPVVPLGIIGLAR